MKSRRQNQKRCSVAVLCLGLVLALAAPDLQAATKVDTSTSCQGKKWSHARFSHRIFDKLLQRYVSNGRVNYNGLRKQRKSLDTYLCRLAHTDVAQIKNRKGRFAFWINAYNAVTLRAVLDRLPKSSSAQKGFSVAKKSFNFWKGSKYQVARRWLTLDQIENKVIRPTFVDPRLHFALVCAARGCPHLASRAYTGSRLSKMLNKNTRSYLASPNGARLDRAKKTLQLSKLFTWYRKDFITKQFTHPLLFVAKHSNKSDGQFIRDNYKQLSVKWLDYNWKLNAR